MAAWVQLAMLPPDAPQRLRKLSSPDLTLAKADPLQTEYFLHSLLLSKGVDVHRIAFHRTDVRRVPGSIGGKLAKQLVRARNGRNGSATAAHLAAAAEEERVCVPDLYWSCRKGAHMRGLDRCHDWRGAKDGQRLR